MTSLTQILKIIIDRTTIETQRKQIQACVKMDYQKSHLTFIKQWLEGIVLTHLFYGIKKLKYNILKTLDRSLSVSHLPFNRIKRSGCILCITRAPCALICKCCLQTSWPSGACRTVMDSLPSNSFIEWTLLTCVLKLLEQEYQRIFLFCFFSLHCLTPTESPHQNLYKHL